MLNQPSFDTTQSELEAEQLEMLLLPGSRQLVEQLQAICSRQCYPLGALPEMSATTILVGIRRQSRELHRCIDSTRERFQA